MIAAVWHGRGDLRVEDVSDAPPPGEGEVRLAVEWCGICGTDVSECLTGPHFIPVGTPHPLTHDSAPLVLGHEVAARVADVGAEVTGLAEGDLVAVDGIYTCGTCFWCRRGEVTQCPSLASIGLHTNGGLAEMLTVPAATCAKVPNGVDCEVAALAEPFAVAVRALRRGRLAAGESVMVFGAGAVGACLVRAALAFGARAVFVVDPSRRRRALARSLGASAAFAPTEGIEAELRTATDGRGADVVVDATGSSRVVGLALRSARAGGRCVVVGLPDGPSQVDLFALAVEEKELLGSLSHARGTDFATAVALLPDAALDAHALISRRVDLVDVVDVGLPAVQDLEATGVKVLVKPGEPLL